MPTDDRDPSGTQMNSPYGSNPLQDLSEELYDNQNVIFDDTWLQTYDSNSRGLSHLEEALAFTEEIG